MEIGNLMIALGLDRLIQGIMGRYGIWRIQNHSVNILMKSIWTANRH